MKNITIKDMTLENFKGITYFHLNPEGRNASIFAHNKVGKTTVFDAFLWCLTDKDSLGNTRFDIIPHDKNHQQIHHLETKVKLSLNVDDKTIVLQKNLQEKWTRPRGQKEEVYSGTEKSYEIDGMDVNQKDYKARINKIIPDEQVFKLLTNIRFFNEQLSWKERRDLLFQLIPAFDQKTFIQQHEKYESLKLIHDLDSFEKTSAKAIKDLQIQQVKTAAKAEELENFLKNESKVDEAGLRKVLEAGAKEVAELRKKLSKLVTERELIPESSNIKRNALINDLTAKKEMLKVQIGNLESELKALSTKIDINDKLTNDLRKTVIEKKTALKKFSVSPNCQTCEQPIPDQKKDAIAKKYRADTNNEIAEMVKRGRALVLSLDMDKLIVLDLQELVSKKHTEQVRIEEELNMIVETKNNDDNNNTELQAKIEKKQKEIERKEAAFEKPRQELAKIEQSIYAKKRIAELRTEYEETGRQIIMLEQQLSLIKDFRIEKNKLLTEPLNTLFALNQFELFETSQDGSETETCKTLVDGARYEGNANNADRIRSGLELCNIFSKHYQVCFPIFLDNAESICDMVETEAQLIQLIVSKGQMELAVKFEEKQGKLW